MAVNRLRSSQSMLQRRRSAVWFGSWRRTIHWRYSLECRSVGQKGFHWRRWFLSKWVNITVSCIQQSTSRWNSISICFSTQFVHIAARLSFHRVRSCTRLGIICWNRLSGQRRKLLRHQMHLTDCVEYETVPRPWIPDGLCCAVQFERKLLLKDKRKKSIWTKLPRRQRSQMQ